MSKSQWGHGYYTGKKKAQEESPGYVGLFYLSYKNGELHHQGKIDKQIKENEYLTTLYSWFDGYENGTEIIDPDSKTIKLFYDHDNFILESMRSMVKQYEKHGNERLAANARHWYEVEKARLGK